MKLSCLPVSYYGDILSTKMSLGDWAAEARALDLDAIDLSVILLSHRDGAYLDTVRKDIESTGMKVHMVTAYPDFTHPDDDYRKQQSDKLRADIESAAAIGAKYVRVTAGQAHPAVTREDGIEWALKGIMESLSDAKRCGIKLVYENHSKPGVWEYADFSHPEEIFLELVRRTERTDLGINFDTASPLVAGGDSISLLQKIIHRVWTIHAADNAVIGSMKPSVIGSGLVPFQEIFRVLKQSGFSGWVSIEEASGTGRAGVRTAVKYVRETWEKA